jgi:hypothetical protein
VAIAKHSTVSVVARTVVLQCPRSKHALQKAEPARLSERGQPIEYSQAVDSVVHLGIASELPRLH